MRTRSPLPTAALRTVFATTLIAGLGIGAAAQAPAEASDGPGQPGTNRRPLDGVVAIVGDRAILHSTIEREAAAQGLGPDDSAAEHARAREMILRDLARREIWVQYGKAIGREDPEMFEEQIVAMLAEYKREEIQKYGSLTRMNAELAKLNTSWQALAAEERRRILGASARQHAIHQRFREAFHLLVTPQEMLEHYEQHRAEYGAVEFADLEWISFSGEHEPTLARAEQAAAAWRESGRDARDIAREFGGVALPRQEEVQQDAADPRAPFLKEIAAERAEGEVVGPIVREDSLFLVKVVRRMSQPERRFDDPLVQADIRAWLVREKLLELEGGILRFKAQQIDHWPPWIL